MKQITRKLSAALLALLAVLSASLPTAAAETEDTGKVFGTLWDHFTQAEEEWIQTVTIYDEVPLYYQTDYPDTPYGRGTVSSSGCGITCLAMAATYLKDRMYLPDELAEEFGSLQMSNVQRIDYAIEALDLPLACKPTKWEQMAEALRGGQIVILLVNDKTAFSSIQHFLVLTGMTGDGRVLINDPFKPNYSNRELTEGFILGFPERDLAAGFDGGWIFGDKEPQQDPVISESYRAFRSNDWNLE